MRSRAMMGNDSHSINMLELFSMVCTAYVMIMTRKDLPRQEEEAMLTRRDNSSAVQWVLNCKGGKDDVRARGLMRILGALEVKGRWRFQAKHVAGVDSSLPGLITRCEPSRINAELKR